MAAIDPSVGVIGAAAIAAIPASIGAWNSRKAKKNTTTSNGTTLAQHVERMETKLDTHIMNQRLHIAAAAQADTDARDRDAQRNA